MLSLFYYEKTSRYFVSSLLRDMICRFAVAGVLFSTFFLENLVHNFCFYESYPQIILAISLLVLSYNAIYCIANYLINTSAIVVFMLKFTLMMFVTLKFSFYAEV
jgi:hypothetical protein